MKKYRKKKKGQKPDWLLVFLVGTTLLSGAAVNLLYGKPVHEFLKAYGLAIMLLFILLTGVGLSKWKELVSGKNSIWIGIGYLASLALIAASIRCPVYNFWFLGSALIGILVNGYVGVIFHFILAYLYCGLNGSSMEWFLLYFMIGSLICLLGKSLCKTANIVYGTIIVLSCNTILLFVINNFIFQESINREALYSLASTAAVLFAGCGALAVFGKKNGEEERTEPRAEEPVEKKLSTKELRQIEIDLVEPKDAIYDLILEEDYELLLKLREKSPGLYAHSQRVGELAANGAVILGCSEKIAKAGGLYHEIGRLAGKDYIEEGAKLLKEHRFPKEVIDVLLQQNSKLEKPKSKEAAIVMLSESVVSTVAYFEKEKRKAIEAGTPYKEQPLPKIVENIFDIRLGKGSLDDSGVTILEYKKLKNYYMGIYS